MYVSGVIAAQQGKQDEALAAFERVSRTLFLRLAKFGYRRAIGTVFARRSGKLPNWIHQTPITSEPSLELPRQGIQEKELTQRAQRRERRPNWSSSDIAKDGLFRCARRGWSA